VLILVEFNSLCFAFIKIGLTWMEGEPFAAVHQLAKLQAPIGGQGGGLTDQSAVLALSTDEAGFCD